jgi:uncharacterized protein YuzE
MKFQYDRHLDSLLVYKENRKAHSSIELGEIIISLDKNSSINAVEILNPDKLFSIPKKKLMGISSASMSSQHRGNILWIHILLKLINESEPIDIPVPLAQPLAVHN